MSDLRTAARESRTARPADQSGPESARAAATRPAPESAPGATARPAATTAATIRPGRASVGPDPEPVSVYAAWRRVMRRVTSIQKTGALPVGKGEGGRTVPFRGINQLLDELGPALREFGVFIVPTDTAVTYNSFKTGSGASGVTCLARVTYRIIGPADDHIEVVGQGEANDYADRATTKATRVALRNMLYDMLAVPTADRDPEEEYIERGTVGPADWAAEILNPATSSGRLRQIGKEVRDAQLGGALVDTPAGEMTLAALGQRVSTERTAGRDPFPTTEATTEAEGQQPA